LADGAPQRLAELWNGVEISATNSTRRFVVAARSGGQPLLPHFSFKPEKQMMTRSLHCFRSWRQELSF